MKELYVDLDKIKDITVFAKMEKLEHLEINGKKVESFKNFCQLINDSSIQLTEEQYKQFSLKYGKEDKL